MRQPLGRLVVIALLLLALAFFLLDGAINAGSRLKQRPATATPITPTATPLRR